MQSEFLVACENALQTAAVVIMAMAQDHGIDLVKVDTQYPGIIGDGQILPGIEQNFAIAGFDIKRQTMLSQQSPAALGNGIFDEGRDAKLHRCPPVKERRLSNDECLINVSLRSVDYYL